MELLPTTAVYQLRGLASRERSTFFLSMQFPKSAREAFAELGRLLDQTDAADQSKQLFDLLSGFALDLDCPWIAYGPPAPGPRFIKPVRRDPAIMLNCPDEWQERYSVMGYHKLDPLINKKSRQRTSAFPWTNVYNEQP